MRIAPPAVNHRSVAASLFSSLEGKGKAIPPKKIPGYGPAKGAGTTSSEEGFLDWLLWTLLL